MSDSLPLLYSFRRCPYAMRARLGIAFAGLPVALREVVLKNKPPEMLAISPKGTVPVLQLPDGQVIEESIEIVEWALDQQDPQGLLGVNLAQADALIERNDNEFKHWLDRYKYADRYPEQSPLYYRRKGEAFLQRLEQQLTQHRYLLGSAISKADIALVPFVRQFAHVDRDTFYALPYPHLQAWLRAWLTHPLFERIMKKYAPWQAGEPSVQVAEGWVDV